MPILLDLQQVMLANLSVSLGKYTNTKIEESLLRHMILNSIRANRMKFKQDYGELIICCDSNGSWRKEYYPFYKAHRKKARDASEIDWKTLFKYLDNIRLELKENFPYRVIDAPGAEADDIIATLVLKILNNENTLILSGDKDFIQLHKSNVKQYDPIRKKFIRHKDPTEYLFEHIIRGDSGDGIPNILSEDDCFVAGKRQKPLTISRIEFLKNDPKLNNSRNYIRNETLISLYKIPDNVISAITDDYNNQAGKNRNKIMNYFIKNKLKHLMECLTDF